MRLFKLRVWHGGLVLVLVAAVAFVFFFPGDEPAPERASGPPGTGPITLVSIGDSSVSGEGTGEYVPETNGPGGNWCHRSPKSTVHVTSVPGIEKTVNLACSGAATEHVRLTDKTKYTEGSQAAQLRELTKNHRVAGVVVAGGANDDPKFSHRLNECAQAWWGSTPCSDAMARHWPDTINAMVPKVVSALKDVRGVLAEAGYDRSDYQLIVQSYPSPVGPDIPESLRSLDGCPFRRHDLRWISTEGVRILAEGMSRAAEQVGARFLDLSRAGEGHESCSGGHDPGAEWFTRLTVRWDDLGDVERASHAAQESFHANIAGHAQFARCLSEFFVATDPAAACREGEDGNLHPAPPAG